MYKEIEGDLIELGLNNQFDVITHGCNCFCTMKSGIAPLMAKAFGCDKFKLEKASYKGSINKLGQIDGQYNRKLNLTVLNSYTQYNYGKNHIDGVANPLDYEALALCLRKINHSFKGLRVGLPKIGGNWGKVKSLIQSELKDCDVTVVILK
jgi:O-acetyl-ADP-ribose deacetylase (regulator of RNase III)